MWTYRLVFYGINLKLLRELLVEEYFKDNYYIIIVTAVELSHEKTNNLVFQPGPTLTRLYSNTK